MPKVIQWVGQREGDIIWRFPSNQIEWGSQLVVEESQAAVFFRDGKAYDVFRSGRHTITTANLPLLGKLLGAIGYGGTVPFTATVIFVSLKQFQGKFGGKTQTRELAPLMFNGSFWFRVSEPNLFVQEVVGGQGAYTTGQVSDFLRGYLNQSLMSELAQHSLDEVYGKLDEASKVCWNAAVSAFSRIGLELIDLKFEGIDTTPEWRDRLFFIRQGAAATEVLRMQTAQKMAESLSQSPGAGVGAGLMVGVPFVMPPAQPQQAPQAQPTVVVACPKCGHQNPQGSRFCGNCGSPLSPQPQQRTVRCPNGHEVPEGVKFCPECGARMTLTCPNGHQVPPGVKFCPECGAKVG
ncbi:MAG: SPFH domain-containing protein [Nitrososphaerota archaeon]